MTCVIKRHLTIQYNEQSDYLKKLLDRSDKPKKRVRRKRKINQEEASKIVENSFRRKHIEPPKRTTSRVKIERIQLPKTNRAESQSKFKQYLYMTLSLTLIACFSILLRTHESEIAKILSLPKETTISQDTLYIASYFQ